MTTVRQSAELTYTPQQLFDLVNNIEAYPEFIDECSDSAILKKTHTSVEGSITTDALGYRKTFATKNKLEPPHRITMQLLNGPFKYLNGAWEFKALTPNTTRISLNIKFELVHTTMRPFVQFFLERFSPKLIKAFSIRAKDLYCD